jgi:hypothetical protein
MRIVTQKFKVYKFDELPEDGKEKAIEKLWNINVDHDWWDCEYDDAENIGIEISSFDIYRKDIQGRLLVNAIDVKRNILKDHGKSCETVATVNDWDFRTRKEDDEDFDHNFLSNLLQNYLTILNNSYEYLTSKEGIIEAIKANDYDFLDNGDLF